MTNVIRIDFDKIRNHPQLVRVAGVGLFAVYYNYELKAFCIEPNQFIFLGTRPKERRITHNNYIIVLYENESLKHEIDLKIFKKVDMIKIK